MTIVNEKPLSSLYDFLGASEQVLTKIPDGQYDAIYICDTGCFDMLGAIYIDNAELFRNTPTVNIDHHGSCYGDICWSTIGNEFASATMMVAELIRQIEGNHSITPTIATALLLGVYYDTECFRNCNTTPEAYEFSAAMLRSGANHDLLIRSLYQSTDPAYVALYGEVLATLRPLSGGIGMF